MRLQQVTIDTDDLEGATLMGEITAPDEQSMDDMNSTLVIMMHDFPYSHSCDHDGLFQHLRGIFDQYGLQTLTFDFESCGESEGLEEDFTLESARENLERTIRWAKRRGFEKYIFVACGAAAALALEQTDKSTRLAFLFWPAVDLAAYAGRLFYQGNDKTIVAKGRRIAGDLVTQMKVYDTSAIMKSLKLPILIQYGAQDDIVGVDQIDIIKSGFNALRIDITSYGDGGYGLTDPRHRKMMEHHISQFLHKYA